MSLIEVLWPNGAISKIERPEINKRHLLHQKDATKGVVLDFPFVDEKKDLPYREV